MTQEAALYAFLGGTGLPVYAEGEVPEEAPPGYLTAAFAGGLWGEYRAVTADLWLRGGQRDINAAARALLKTVGRGGRMLPCDGGALWLLPGSPSAAAVTDDTDRTLRRRRLNFTVYILADPGSEGGTI